ncbi:hypothetical protein [Rhodococcus sp. USK13]|uniref:hypothetical protein n=1 Tax=Rhodococcus sp. USK13 TaxID=2806442 RepID=UPI0032D583D1
MQIAAKDRGRHEILEHVGSAHTDGELAALLQIAREKLTASQQELDLGLDGGDRGSEIVAKRSRWLIEAIKAGRRRLGFDVIDHDAFFQLVLGRIVESTPMSDTSRVVGEIALTPPPAIPTPTHRSGAPHGITGTASRRSASSMPPGLPR